MNEPELEDQQVDEQEWRRRALTAESRLEQAAEELVSAQAAIDASERKREAERLLIEHGAHDLETALMLTEAAVSQMEEPDIAAAVNELRSRKAFLFAPKMQASAMSSAAETSEDPLAEAAAEARESGDRSILLRYLRLKRTRN